MLIMMMVMAVIVKAMINIGDGVDDDDNGSDEMMVMMFLIQKSYNSQNGLFLTMIKLTELNPAIFRKGILQKSLGSNNDFSLD